MATSEGQGSLVCYSPWCCKESDVTEQELGNWGFQGGLVVKNLTASAGDARDSDSIPVLGRFPGEGNGTPL